MRFVPMSALVLAATTLAGCIGGSADRDSMEYQAGYGDGCATGGDRSAHIQGEPRRNADLYEKSSDYRAGWASGYNVCGARADPGHL